MDDIEFLYLHGKVIDTVYDVFSVGRDLDMYVDSNQYVIDIPLVKNVVCIELLEYSFPDSNYLINQSTNKFRLNDTIDYEIPFGNYGHEEFVAMFNQLSDVQVEYVARLDKLRLKSVSVLFETNTGLSKIMGLPATKYVWGQDVDLPHRVQLLPAKIAYIGLENVIRDRNLTKFKIVLGKTVINPKDRRQMNTFDHPIGKLASLSVALKHSNNDLIQTNGVDHWFTLNITHISMDAAKLPMDFPHKLAPPQYNPQGGYYGNLPSSDEEDIF